MTLYTSYRAEILCLFILLIIPSLYFTADDEKITKENANRLLDTTISFLSRKYKEPMDPIPMKPRAIGINGKVGRIPVVIQTEIKEGYITKVGKIKRIGNATMTVIRADDDDSEDSTVIEAHVALEDIQFNATIIFHVMGMKHEENASGSVGRVESFLILTTNGTSGDRDLPYFKITDIQGLDFQLDGPFEAIDRLRNIPLRITTRVVMRTNLKRIILAIVSNASQSTIKAMTVK